MRASDGKLDLISAQEVSHWWHTGRNVVYQKIRSLRKGGRLSGVLSCMAQVGTTCTPMWFGSWSSVRASAVVRSPTFGPGEGVWTADSPCWCGCPVCTRFLNLGILYIHSI